MLKLRTLGALDLLRPDGTRVHSVIVQPKRAAVLIYLAMCEPDQFVRRDVLLSLFWPERDDAAARHALSQTLYKLRQAIGPESIEGRADDEVRLSTTTLRCDAALFLDAVSACRWSEALQLYRGDLLPGFYLSGAGGFERWLEDTRQRLRTAAGRAAWSLAREQVGRGALLEAEENAVRALELDGANETEALAFVRLLAAAGATRPAIRYYESLCERLKRDYEIEPSRESQRVRAELRALEAKSDSESSETISTLGDSRDEERKPAGTSRFATIPRRRIVYGSMTLACALIALSLMPFNFATSHAAHNEHQIRALVVLPFENLMKDEGQAYFVDGMHEAVIEELAHIASLRVTSRTSALHYRGSSEPLPQIARELDVDAVIEGSVLRSGDTVRISVQLVAATPERHLWAESYTRSLVNVLKLHSDVARDIARNVAASMSAPEAAHFVDRPPVIPAAYEAWLKGSYRRSRRSARDASECIKYAERATMLDSNYAAAYELLAQCSSIATFVASAPPAASFERTKSAARRAIQLDATLPRAHIALARALAMYDWDWAGAEREYLRALELNPGLAEAQAEYGWFLSWHRRREESLTHLLRAEELDPISPDIAMHVSMGILYSGDFDEALKRAQRAAAIDSSFVFAYDRLHFAFDAKGATVEALAAASKAAQLAGPRDLRRRAFLGYAYARAGEREKAMPILTSLLRISRSSYVPPTSIALVYLGLGDRDAALDFLEAGYRDHDGDLVTLNAFPVWSPLRASPRFQSILHRMNFGAATPARARTAR